MKKVAMTIVVVSIMWVVGCGGATAPINSIKNIAGNYVCINNCSGTCTFTTATITQNGNQLTGTTPTSNCEGIVDLDEFALDCTNTSNNELTTCGGDPNSENLTVNCNTGSIVCQVATFQKQ